MPEFSYLGVNSKGKTLSGNVVAGSLKEARKDLRSKGLTPLKLALSESAAAEVGTKKNAKNSQSKEI